MPGKRPRITLTPTLVIKDGQPVIASSVAGGDVQDQVALQLLVDLIDFGMSPKEAVTAPRFSTEHHIGSFAQTPPKLGSLSVNAELGEAEIEALRQRGHDVTLSQGVVGYATILRRDPRTGMIEGAGDPRAGRHAKATR